MHLVAGATTKPSKLREVGIDQRRLPDGSHRPHLLAGDLGELIVVEHYVSDVHTVFDCSREFSQILT